jgi:hypothetical protein
MDSAKVEMGIVNEIMRTEVIEILLLPKDDAHERVKYEHIPGFVPLHSAAAALLSFSTSERFVWSRGLYPKTYGCSSALRARTATQPTQEILLP